MKACHRAMHSARSAPGSSGVGKEGSLNPRKLPIVAFSADRGKRRWDCRNGVFNLHLCIGRREGGK